MDDTPEKSPPEGVPQEDAPNADAPNADAPLKGWMDWGLMVALMWSEALRVLALRVLALRVLALRVSIWMIFLTRFLIYKPNVMRSKTRFLGVRRRRRIRGGGRNVMLHRRVNMAYGFCARFAGGGGKYQSCRGKPAGATRYAG